MFQLKHNAIEQGQIVARNILGENVKYLGAYTFARAHFFNTHAATFGKTLRGTDCLLGDKEVIEKESGTDYLRIILLDGKVIGGQAIGSYADEIGLFIGAMWRKDDMNRVRSKLIQMTPSGVAHSWPVVRLGHLLSRMGTNRGRPAGRRPAWLTQRLSPRLCRGEWQKLCCSI